MKRKGKLYLRDKVKIIDRENIEKEDISKKQHMLDYVDLLS